MEPRCSNMPSRQTRTGLVSLNIPWLQGRLRHRILIRVVIPASRPRRRKLLTSRPSVRARPVRLAPDSAPEAECARQKARAGRRRACAATRFEDKEVRSALGVPARRLSRAWACYGQDAPSCLADCRALQVFGL